MRRFFSLSKSQLSSLQCRVHSYCLDFKYVQGTMQNHAESFVRISFATGPCRTNWPQRCRWGSFSDALEGNMATILVLQIYLFIGIYLFNINIYIYIQRYIYINIYYQVWIHVSTISFHIIYIYSPYIDMECMYEYINCEFRNTLCTLRLMFEAM